MSRTVLPPFTLAPDSGPRRLLTVTCGALAIGAALAPAGELASSPASVPVVAGGMLLLARLFSVVAVRVRTWWLVLVVAITCGVPAGVMNLELYRVFRSGWSGLENGNLVRVDSVFGLVIAAFWAAGPLLALFGRRIRGNVTFATADILQRRLGGLMIAAAGVMVGCALSDRASSRWGWLSGAGLLVVIGAGFALASTHRLTRRRAWLARVEETGAGPWRILPLGATREDDALLLLDAGGRGLNAGDDRVLVHSGLEASPGGVFRDAPYQTRVARVRLGPWIKA